MNACIPSILGRAHEKMLWNTATTTAANTSGPATGRTRAPSWRNEVTLRSVEMFWEYEPGAYIQWVSPTPLLVVVAARDHLTVSDLAIEAYERALEPKRLVVLPGAHFDAYTVAFEDAAGPARDWFAEHLMG